MQVQYRTDLTPYNTFGLTARAAAFTALKQEEDIYDIVRLPEFDRQTVLWLGGGSNIVLTADYPGLVVHMENKGIRELSRENGVVRIEAQAGEVWHDFVLHTLELGLSGLENLSLIPGMVGASPVQNIGAYGVEVKDVIHSVRCFDLEKGEFVELSNADCRFAYRESLFKQEGKGRYVITAVVFALHEQFRANLKYGDLTAAVAAICADREPTAKDVSQAVCAIRMSKLPDPKVLGNVGSFFKNPVVAAADAERLRQEYPDMPVYPQADGSVKLAAGWLIDQCRLKGFQIGGAAVHEKQALVLVNKDRASPKDVRQLADYICRAVADRFQVELHSEPNWLPSV
ncbi:UDP-N-acetylmuramate dehydrogenase [Neisseria animalis]|uniref:UDP-N-acetylenolpyruvoylglucosamine reductase n=1 Tax=Neisseria animalis TaxID=492 RepID=A0A5P3MR36_NEIAN|nr:UDP-N-acetylmuramate dehydrogenase [Neisseria animalis]QEY23179.1 UDP-N-acetylmuramate dehydrogenase [Neisseria animalis]ROW32508.1 UDP-N-acetylmuramate dehydrogenase [Neisseria animalis]VEE08313.1 UDP-N-acetylmuramate dehydrogenase [Neisseria animalis]